MLSFNDGVHLRGTGLHLDARRGKRRGIVTHAHSDHVGPHDCRVSTPATARLCDRRFGAGRAETRAFGEPWEEGRARVTLLPAGHILGSAMVLVEAGGVRVLYTGDFRTRPSLTAEACRPVPADVLVTECTFGDPRYRFPPRDRVVEQLVDFIEAALRRRQVPVLLAYALGKAQEVARILGDLGYRVILHARAYELLETYRELGVAFHNCERLARDRVHGAVVIVPPFLARGRWVERFPRRCVAYLSGWAMDAGARGRYGADRAFPLSDHADFDELVEFVRAVGPRQIYTLHGPDGFGDHLRKLGFRAEPTRIGAQMQLL